MRKKAKNLKRGDKILIPLESGIYCTKTPLCLAIAKLTNVTFSEKLAIINSREYKPFSLPLELFVKIEK